MQHHPTDISKDNKRLFFLKAFGVPSCFSVCQGLVWREVRQILLKRQILLCSLELLLLCRRLVGTVPGDFGGQLGRGLVVAEAAVCVVALVLVVLAEELHVVFDCGASADLFEVVGFGFLKEPKPHKPHKLRNKDAHLKGSAYSV